MSINQYRLLIANRGEIARRILKACREKNLAVAVIATPEDRNSLVCHEADAVLEVDSFLNAAQIIEQAKFWGAHLLHPGYGFLSENAGFAQLCEENGIVFVGPASEQIKILGSKESSKKIAKLCNVPVLASLSSIELQKIPRHQWKAEFAKLGIHPPYLVKASGGGGGRGMRIVHNFDDISDALTRASHEASVAFNDPAVFVERYLKHPRHIEIQVFGDGKGSGVFFGERECSLQRRHQKVIEECPSVVVTDTLRKCMGQAALALVKHTKYRGAGTVEFLLDENNHFHFLEMNTRLQVEHPVTEMVYGVDLVHAQIDLALGEFGAWIPRSSRGMTLQGRGMTLQGRGMTLQGRGMTLQGRGMTLQGRGMTLQGRGMTAHGVALEARILAENPRQNFLPTPGTIEEYIEPQGDGIRVDSGVTKGSVILPTFDSMIAKLIVHAETRTQAIAKLQYALKNYFIFGMTTNIPFLISLISRKEFLQGEESTHFIEEHLDELNEKLIPKTMIDFFESFACREKLFADYKNSRQNSNSDDTEKFRHQSIFAKQKFENKNLPTPYFDLKKIKYVSFINSNGSMEINIEGEILTLENPGFYNQSCLHNSENSLEIKSPMAGKVYDVLIEAGNTVKKGDLLFIIESMKMQLEVRASQDGVVRNITVSKGEILKGAHNLATIESHAVL